MTSLKDIDQDNIQYELDCIKIRQPIGDIYVATMPSNIITKITFFDVRRIEKEARDVETYLGIQRPLNSKRIKDIQTYVNFVDATFPTSIILAIDDEYCSFDSEKNKICIRNYKLGDATPSARISDIAKVLDGQHRIEGLQGFRKEVFEVPVSIFIGADLADQAYIFSIVNLEQSKVSKNLAYDLYELARSRSPQRTCHNIAVALDRDPNGPLFERIKRLGTTTPGRRFEPISQSTFVESLMRYISDEPKKDRDLILRGRKLEDPVHKKDKLIFRQMFIEERDKDITFCVNNFFEAVRQKWPTAWNTEAEGYMLNRTNGFRALMRLFYNTYRYSCTRGSVLQVGDAFRVLDKIKSSDNYFTVENFPPGSSGENRLYRFMFDAVGFLPE